MGRSPALLVERGSTKIRAEAESLQYVLVPEHGPQPNLEEFVGLAYALWLTQPGSLAHFAPKVYHLFGYYAFGEMR